MNFAGIQKLTLLDFPGKTACTVFTEGCNMRCPFCHNASLVLPEKMGGQVLSEEELLAFLEKRLGLLDGICITGGEPLLYYNELYSLIPKIKSLGYSVKLDTNGTKPEPLAALIENGYIDYAAMDIKNSLPHYSEACGIDNFNTSLIVKSIEILKNSKIPHEFRTTVVHELHSPEKIREIAEMICGEAYFLQEFKDSGDLVGCGLTPPTKEELLEMKEMAMQFCNARIRGE